MTERDVITRSKNGQWVNEVEGSPELSRSYTSRDEAVEAGSEFAAAQGSRHVVENSEPTGAITDGGDALDEVPIVGDKPARADGHPDTTDENGFPLENPSG